MKRIKVLMTTTLVFSLLLISAMNIFTEVIEIEFWHAMSGGRLAAVEKLVNQFNEINPNIKVKAQFTGSYAEALTQAISAVRAGNPPHIVQVYEVGTQTMLDSDAICYCTDIRDSGKRL